MILSVAQQADENTQGEQPSPAEQEQVMEDMTMELSPSDRLLVEALTVLEEGSSEQEDDPQSAVGPEVSC